jgi:hypothetical protein
MSRALSFLAKLSVALSLFLTFAVIGPSKARAECTQQETSWASCTVGVQHWLKTKLSLQIKDFKDAKKWCESPPVGLKVVSGTPRNGDVVVWNSPPAPNSKGHVGVMVDSKNYQATSDWCGGSCTSSDKKCVNVGSKKFAQRAVSSFGTVACYLRKSA